LKTAALETAAPSVSFSAPGSFEGFARAGAPITLQGADQGSGIAFLYYALDPSAALVAAGLGAQTVGQFTVYSGPFTATGTAVAFGAEDRAGNFSALSLLSLDGTAPVTAPSAPLFFGGFVESNARIVGPR